MRLFGYDLTVAKADRGVVNAGGSARLQELASLMARGDQLQAGAGTAAMGTRPDPGALPISDPDVDLDPLRFQFPWGGNLTYTPRTGYGTPFATLRNLASVSPEIFTCIQCRKDQMAALDWDFTVRDKQRASEDIGKINAARQFFAKPDGVTPFKTWLQTLVDEILTIDALSIYKRRTRGPRSGRATGTDLYGYEIIDGSTIKVLVDDRGFVPAPPMVAYRQIIYGAPMAGGDLTRDELLYLPKNVRTWSPYGMSPTEALLLIVTGALNRQMFNLSHYQEGNVPEALAGVPEGWSPKQISQFNEYWNVLMRGDPANRSRMRFVPKTIADSIHEFKKPDFSTSWELWLLKVICACFGVTPSEIGFTDDVNKATSKTQGDVNQRRGVKPMANFVKGLLDTMLATDLGLPDLEATYSGGEGEDALSQARIEDIKIRNGSKSLDEIRTANGDPALGVGPVIVTSTGPIFWELLAAQAAAGGVDDTNGDQSDNEDEAGASAVAVAEKAELKKFQTVALKAVKAGQPVPTFTSAVLPERLHTRLARALETVTTPDDVRKVFAAVVKAQRLSDQQKKRRRQLEQRVSKVFTQQRRAFTTHLAAGLEAQA